MVDLITLAITFLIVLAVFLRKTSAGVAILGLLAGVMLDQLLAQWVTGLLPSTSSSLGQYLPVVVHLLITFTPVCASVIAVKVNRQNPILSLLTSLVLGFLIVFFGLKIVQVLPVVAEPAKNSGLLTFLGPFQNAILASSAVLAIVEMVVSHRKSSARKLK